MQSIFKTIFVDLMGEVEYKKIIAAVFLDLQRAFENIERD